MPSYFYTAKNLNGETKTGKMEAKDQLGVARELRQMNLVPINIGAVSGNADVEKEKSVFKKIASFDVGAFIPAIGRVSIADKMIFSRHLSVMISGGVPITEALEVLESQAKNSKFKKAISGIAEDIRKGKTISGSLETYKDIFGPLYISMVKSGDLAGNLSEVLNLLAEQLKKEHELLSRIRGALMYPAVILIAMGGIGALMMVMVVPKLSDVFSDLDAELPLLTRVVIGSSNFITAYWYVVLGLLAVSIYIINKFFSTMAGKKILSWAFLNLPGISPLTKKVNSARMSRTLSSLIKGGVSILDALQISEDILSNQYYKQSISYIRKKVKSGSTLFDAMKQFENVYPGIIIQMVRVGEESGSLASTLDNIANFYEEEVANATKNLSSIIEPVLMIIIGAIVGIFAISMIQPMYSIMGNL